MAPQFDGPFSGDHCPLADFYHTPKEAHRRHPMPICDSGGALHLQGNRYGQRTCASFASENAASAATLPRRRPKRTTSAWLRTSSQRTWQRQ